MKAKMHKATTFGYGLLMLCLLSLWALDVQAQDGVGGGSGSLGESGVRSGTGTTVREVLEMVPGADGKTLEKPRHRQRT